MRTLLLAVLALPADTSGYGVYTCSSRCHFDADVDGRSMTIDFSHARIVSSGSCASGKEVEYSGAEARYASKYWRTDGGSFCIPGLGAQYEEVVSGLEFHAFGGAIARVTLSLSPISTRNGRFLVEISE